jgi:hypothetical protein
MCPIKYPAQFSKDFPILSEDPSCFSVTSEDSKMYNCIAYAMGEEHQPWWPGEYGHYWPKDCPGEPSIEAFDCAFATKGYATCESGEPQSGYQKVALYAQGDLPKHAAKQLPNGRWSSKLGRNVDIEHNLSDIEGPCYGKVIKFFARRCEHG